MKVIANWLLFWFTLSYFNSGFKVIYFFKKNHFFPLQSLFQPI